MKRMLFIVAMAVTVMLISSCKGTTEKITNTSTPSANTTNSSTSSANANTTISKEVQALQLLGSTGEGSINTKCSKVEHISEIIKSQDAFQKLVKNKDFVRDFHETARKIADAAKTCGSDKSEASLLAEKNPAIAQIVDILGKEDSTGKSNFVVEVDKSTKTIPVTLYKFGWLGFAVSNADNKVIGIVMDFNKFKV